VGIILKSWITEGGWWKATSQLYAIRQSSAILLKMVRASPGFYYPKRNQDGFAEDFFKSSCKGVRS